MAAKGEATVPPEQRHDVPGPVKAPDADADAAPGTGRHAEPGPGGDTHAGPVPGQDSRATYAPDRGTRPAHTSTVAPHAAAAPDRGMRGPGTGPHTAHAAERDTRTVQDTRGSGAVPRRGRPRSEAVERSIVDAVVRLLEEGVSISDLSIERIARTAGVGKATIYRRWEGKESLLVDVVRSMEPADPPLPGTSVRDDLVAIVETLRRRGLAKRSSALLHNVFAQMQNYPKLWEMYHRIAVAPRRERMDAVLRRGVENGEIRADVDFDLLGDMFVGPMLVRTVQRPECTPGPGSAELIVDTVLRGVRPHG